MVPRSARAREHRVQYAVHGAAGRGARPPGPGGGVERGGAPPRSTAHRLPAGHDRRRRAGAGDPAAAPRPPGGRRPHGPAAVAAAGRGPPARHRRGEAPLRPRARPLAARRPAATRRARARPDADPPPCRQRRLVDAGPDARGVGALRRLLPRSPLAPAGAAGAVRRLRGLAARLAPRRGAGSPDRLLAPGAGGRAAAARPADGPPAPARPELRRRPPRHLLRRRAGRRGAPAGPQPGAHQLHGAARGAPHPAAPLLRPGRGGGGLANGQPQPGGAGGAHRLFRQHPGAGGRLRARAELPRDAGPGARGGARRLRSPRPAFREAGRGAGAGAQPRSLAALPGALRFPERRRAGSGNGTGAGGGRARLLPLPGRRGRRQVRPHLRDRGAGEGLCGHPGAQYRPLRSRHGLPPSGAAPRHPRRRGGGPGVSGLRPPPPRPGAARPAPLGVERHGRQLPRRLLPSSSSRRRPCGCRRTRSR